MATASRLMHSSLATDRPGPANPTAERNRSKTHELAVAASGVRQRILATGWLSPFSPERTSGPPESGGAPSRDTAVSTKGNQRRLTQISTKNPAPRSPNASSATILNRRGAIVPPASRPWSLHAITAGRLLTTEPFRNRQGAHRPDNEGGDSDETTSRSLSEPMTNKGVLPIGRGAPTGAPRRTTKRTAIPAGRRATGAPLRRNEATALTRRNGGTTSSGNRTRRTEAHRSSPCGADRLPDRRRHLPDPVVRTSDETNRHGFLKSLNIHGLRRSVAADRGAPTAAGRGTPAHRRAHRGGSLALDHRPGCAQ